MLIRDIVISSFKLPAPVEESVSDNPTFIPAERDEVTVYGLCIVCFHLKTHFVSSTFPTPKSNVVDVLVASLFTVKK